MAVAEASTARGMLYGRTAHDRSRAKDAHVQELMDRVGRQDPTLTELEWTWGNDYRANRGHSRVEATAEMQKKWNCKKK